MINFKILENPNDVPIGGIVNSLRKRLAGKVVFQIVKQDDDKGILQITKLRLHEKQKHNVNVSKPLRGRRPGRWLTWDQKTAVNNTINASLDALDISADVTTLSGRIIIREGREAYAEKDWRRQVGHEVAGVNVTGAAYDVTDAMQRHSCARCDLIPPWPSSWPSLIKSLGKDKA